VIVDEPPPDTPGLPGHPERQVVLDDWSSVIGPPVHPHAKTEAIIANGRTQSRSIGSSLRPLDFECGGDWAPSSLVKRETSTAARANGIATHVTRTDTRHRDFSIHWMGSGATVPEHYSAGRKPLREADVELCTC
jgi:hypothetical protein